MYVCAQSTMYNDKAYILPDFPYTFDRLYASVVEGVPWWNSRSQLKYNFVSMKVTLWSRYIALTALCQFHAFARQEPAQNNYIAMLVGHQGPHTELSTGTAPQQQIDKSISIFSYWILLIWMNNFWYPFWKNIVRDTRISPNTSRRCWQALRQEWWNKTPMRKSESAVELLNICTAEQWSTQTVPKQLSTLLQARDNSNKVRMC